MPEAEDAGRGSVPAGITLFTATAPATGRGSTFPRPVASARPTRTVPALIVPADDVRLAPDDEALEGAKRVAPAAEGGRLGTTPSRLPADNVDAPDIGWPPTGRAPLTAELVTGLVAEDVLRVKVGRLNEAGPGRTAPAGRLIDDPSTLVAPSPVVVVDDDVMDVVVAVVVELVEGGEEDDEEDEGDDEEDEGVGVGPTPGRAPTSPRAAGGSGALVGREPGFELDGRCDLGTEPPKRPAIDIVGLPRGATDPTLPAPCTTALPLPTLLLPTLLLPTLLLLTTPDRTPALPAFPSTAPAPGATDRVCTSAPPTGTAGSFAGETRSCTRTSPEDRAARGSRASDGRRLSIGDAPVDHSSASGDIGLLRSDAVVALEDVDDAIEM